MDKMIKKGIDARRDADISREVKDYIEKEVLPKHIKLTKWLIYNDWAVAWCMKAETRGSTRMSEGRRG